MQSFRLLLCFLSLLLFGALQQQQLAVIERCGVQRESYFSFQGTGPFLSFLATFQPSNLGSDLAVSVVDEVAINHKTNEVLVVGNYAYSAPLINFVSTLPEDFACQGATFIAKLDQNLQIITGNDITPYSLVLRFHTDIVFVGYDHSFQYVYIVGDVTNRSPTCYPQTVYEVNGRSFQVVQYPFIVQLDAKTLKPTLNFPVRIDGTPVSDAATVSNSGELVVFMHPDGGEPINIDGKQFDATIAGLIVFLTPAGKVRKLVQLEGTNMHVLQMKPSKTSDSIFYLVGCQDARGEKLTACNITMQGGQKLFVSSKDCFFLGKISPQGNVGMAIPLGCVAGTLTFDVDKNDHVVVGIGSQTAHFDEKGKQLWRVNDTTSFKTILFSREAANKTSSSIYYHSAGGFLRLNYTTGQVIDPVVQAPLSENNPSFHKMVLNNNGSYYVYGPHGREFTFFDGEENFSYLSKGSMSSFIMKMSLNCSCSNPDCLLPLCGGIKPYHPQVCSSHGECVSPRQCRCKAGFSGAYCERMLCFGIENTDPNVCNGHGVCKEPDSCLCYTDYVGQQCNIAECYGYLSTQSHVCSGNGQCISKDACDCSFNYTGYACDRKLEYSNYCSSKEGYLTIEIEEKVIGAAMLPLHIYANSSTMKTCKMGDITLLADRTLQIDIDEYRYIVAINTTSNTILWSLSGNYTVTSLLCIEAYQTSKDPIVIMSRQPNVDFQTMVIDPTSDIQILNTTTGQLIYNSSLDARVSDMDYGHKDSIFDGRLFVTGYISGYVDLVKACQIVKTPSVSRVFVAQIAVNMGAGYSMKCDWVISSNSTNDHGDRMYFTKDAKDGSEDLIVFGGFFPTLQILQNSLRHAGTGIVKSVFFVKIMLHRDEPRVVRMRSMLPGYEEIEVRHDGRKSFWIGTVLPKSQGYTLDSKVPIVKTAKHKYHVIQKLDSQGFPSVALVFISDDGPVSIHYMRVDKYSGEVYITGSISSNTTVHHFRSFANGTVSDMLNATISTTPYTNRMFVAKLAITGDVEWVKVVDSDTPSRGVSIRFNYEFQILDLVGCFEGPIMRINNYTVTTDDAGEECQMFKITMQSDEKCFACGKRTFVNPQYKNMVLSGDMYSSACLPCPVGYHCPNDNMLAPLPCDVGYYTDAEGSLECQECKAGHFCPNNTVMLPCREEYYQPNNLSTSCTKCSFPSVTNNRNGSTNCTECPHKFYRKSPFECEYCSTLIGISPRTEQECSTINFWVYFMIAVVGFVLTILVTTAGCCLFWICLGIRIQKQKKRKSVIEMALLNDNMDESLMKAELKLNPKLFEVSFAELKELQQIGQGASGNLVFKATYRKQLVAVKVFRLNILGEDEQNVKEFENELNLMANMRHPKVVTFLGAALDLPRICIVMEYCERGSLDSLLKSLSSRRGSAVSPTSSLGSESTYATMSSPTSSTADSTPGSSLRHKSISMTFPDKLRMLIDIAQGMLYLHSRNVIHRDLKPQNILLDRNFTAKITDFGVSKLEAEAFNLTRVGTSIYMSPQVCLGKMYSKKCDVFSFGIIMYQLLEETTKPYGESVAYTNIEVQVAMNENFRPKFKSPELYAAAIQMFASGYQVTPQILDKFCSLTARCWAHEEKDRPIFDEVLEELQDLLECCQNGEETDLLR